MIKKQDWIEFFPFSEPRSEQITAINFILNNFQNGKKFVIAELGTGTGKSAIAVTVSKYMQMKNKPSATSDHKWYDGSAIRGTWYLTTQKTLQKQYINDFGNHKIVQLKSLKSANNYQCQIFDKSSISMSCAEIQRLMNAHKFFQTMYKTCVCKCRYRDEKEKFIEADDSLTNYSYFLAESMYAKGIKPRDLLILDEAHTIEETLSSFIEITLSEKFSKERLNLKTFPKKTDDINAAFTWIKTKYHKALSARIKIVKNMLNDDSDREEKVTSLSAFVKEYEILDKHICKVNRFIEQFNDKNWALTFEDPQGKSLRKLIFKPIDVSIYSREKLFDFGTNVLMLSATIIDNETFCQTLGLKQDETAYLRMPSPFPIENRPLVILPVGHMSKNKIDETLPMMASVVKEILEQHKEEKGVIHCQTFKIANFLQQNIRSNRLLFHDSSNREHVIEQHCDSKEPTVLVSPSMLEGINLDGDKSRFQIFCKIPFPFLGDVVIKKRMELYPGWYALQTLRSIIQGLGRSIRSENDHAITYILDSDWENFFNRNKKLIPDDIVQSIVLQ